MNRIAAILGFLALTVVSRRASADALPASVTSAVVHVDAYEHRSLGAVVGDGRQVLVLLSAIEVDRPGSPDAFVLDARGVRRGARLVATDRASGLALLSVDQELTTTPFAPSDRSFDAPGLSVIPERFATNPLPEYPWITPAPLFAEGHAVAGADGSPIVDEAGRLVGLAGQSSFGSAHALPIGGALARLRDAGAPPPHRRALIPYVGVAMQLDVGSQGAIGASGSVGVRWRDLLEVRSDWGMVFFSDPPPDGSCASHCPVQVRLIMTPSIGGRLRLGGWDGLRAWSVAVTPSLGVALGAEGPVSGRVDKGFALIAPGLALSFGPAELRVRVRLPRGDVTRPVVETALGAYF